MTTMLRFENVRLLGSSIQRHFFKAVNFGQGHSVLSSNPEQVNDLFCVSPLIQILGTSAIFTNETNNELHGYYSNFDKDR